MRRRRPGRFSRQWQRERAEHADAEADEVATALYRIGRLFNRFPMPVDPPRRARAGHTERPYRGFRAGRSRMRPDATGYDEPVASLAPREPGNEHPWLADLQDDELTLDPVLGDSDDEPWVSDLGDQQDADRRRG